MLNLNKEKKKRIDDYCSKTFGFPRRTLRQIESRRQISLGAVGTEGILLVIEICPGTACSVLQRTPAERACFIC